MKLAVFARGIIKKKELGENLQSSGSGLKNFRIGLEYMFKEKDSPTSLQKWSVYSVLTTHI